MGDDLYALFLDPDWQYSCAYFETPVQNLVAAQLAKKRHIAAKLNMRPGQNVLDIGCGWAGLDSTLRQPPKRGVFLASRYLTPKLSERDDAQRTLVSRASIFACKIAATSKGNSIVSFRLVCPGGHIPSLSDIVAPMARAGLIITDVKLLGPHYALTLCAWRTAFLANRAKAARLFDERFCRMWDYYLAASELAFRNNDVTLFKIQFSRRREHVPLTRDYIAEAEAAMREREKRMRKGIDNSM